MILVVLTTWLHAAPAAAEPKAAPWSSASPNVVRDVKNGKPLVIQVLIPLCSNKQIDCGSVVAGKPGRPETNLYWGAIFGARRMFDRKRSGWTLVEAKTGDDVLLERAVYRRFVSGKKWNRPAGERVEQIVVLQAVHGTSIDRAVRSFWSVATRGGSVTFADDGRSRTERVHVAGYAGHNRLMDGKKLPRTPAKGARSPLPSFVLACYSQAYFAEALRKAGSKPLVMTRALMAPEGYVLDAVVKALGDNASDHEVRARAVRAYAKWQRLRYGTASSIFA